MGRIISIPISLAESGIIYTGPCNLCSFLVGVDGSHNPTITIYDGLDDTGDVIVPSVTYDATEKGLQGAVFQWLKRCITGLYIKIACAGTVTVVVDYNQYKVSV